MIKIIDTRDEKEKELAEIRRSVEDLVDMAKMSIVYSNAKLEPGEFLKKYRKRFPHLNKANADDFNKTFRK